MSIEIKEANSVNDTVTEAEKLEKLEAKKAEAKELLRALVAAGSHLGHPTRKKNPKMDAYIHSAKNGLHVIDVSITVSNMMRAAEFLKKQVKLDRNILLVGTSKQASELVKLEAERAGIFFINQRWLGGLITNFDIIRSRLNTLRELEHSRDTGGFKGLGKKEIASINRQILKLNRSLGGLKKMKGRPDVVMVLDQKKDALAITESKKQGNITILSLVDTDGDPTGIDFPIPANDDSISSLSFLLKYFMDVILAARQKISKR
jgi:small subunit ribosomal protein S2